MIGNVFNNETILDVSENSIICKDTYSSNTISIRTKSGCNMTIIYSYSA